MRRAIGQNRRAFLGILLALVIATGAQSYAQGTWTCWFECGGCYGEVSGCTDCNFSIGGDSCSVSGTGCTSVYCTCAPGSTWRCTGGVQKAPMLPVPEN